MKRILIILAALFGIYPSGFAQLSLEECQQLARENYPLIKQFELIEKSRDMNLSNAAKAYLPQLSISGMANLIDGMPTVSMPGTTSKSDNHQFIGIVNLTQTIWDGGTTKTQRKIAVANAEVEKQNIEVLLHEVDERINQLYFGILILDEQLRQTDILNDNLFRNLKRAETAKENGTAYQSDLDAIKVELLKVEQTHINLNTQRKAYIHILSAMIGKDITAEEKLSTPPEILTAANEINRPELHMYEQMHLLNDAQNSAITSRYMPRLGLTGYAIGLTPGIKLGTEKTNHLLMAGVSLSWNIGGLYTRKNDRSLIHINKLKIDNQQETFLFNTNLDLKQTDSQIERSKQLIQKDDEIVRLRESIKQSSEIKYENGVCTMSDLLNDINAESLARQNKALHEIEYLMHLYSHKTISGN